MRFSSLLHLLFYFQRFHLDLCYHSVTMGKSSKIYFQQRSPLFKIEPGWIYIYRWFCYLQLVHSIFICPLVRTDFKKLLYKESSTYSRSSNCIWSFCSRKSYGLEQWIQGISINYIQASAPVWASHTMWTSTTNHNAFPMLTFQILFSGLTFLLLLRSYRMLRLIYASHLTTK